MRDTTAKIRGIYDGAVVDISVLSDVGYTSQSPSLPGEIGVRLDAIHIDRVAAQTSVITLC